VRRVGIGRRYSDASVVLPELLLELRDPGRDRGSAFIGYGVRERRARSHVNKRERPLKDRGILGEVDICSP
jgi:hypothetical protein